MKIYVFWDVIPLRLVSSCWRCDVSCPLHLHLRFFETSVFTCWRSRKLKRLETARQYPSDIMVHYLIWHLFLLCHT